jgi:hypothetical protein
MRAAVRRLQPKTAFSRLPLVHRADLKGRLRVELTRSRNDPAMTAERQKNILRQLLSLFQTNGMESFAEGCEF